MVDIHCHILPAIDDGSKSWEMSLQMCEIAKNDGITHIVATPHCNYEYHYDRDAHSQRLQELRERTDGSIGFSMGCDFHMSYENVQDAMENPQRYTIGGGPYLLVEFHDYSIPPTMTEALQNLCAIGLTPIITHPERNPILQQKPQIVQKWVEVGCIVQVTANSLTGFWGGVAKKTAKWLFQKNAVHVVASDAHDPHRRMPVLSEGMRAAAEYVGPEIARMLVDDNPRAIVEGQPIPYQP
jgi:protein-tyrosine phosphatase